MPKTRRRVPHPVLSAVPRAVRRAVRRAVPRAVRSALPTALVPVVVTVAVLLRLAVPVGALAPGPLPPGTPSAGTSSPGTSPSTGAVSYVAPVDGQVTDPFRPPSTPYGPGNRGVDYATAPGAPVLAPADGEVVFAGQVGGALHVVVLHADGIRTTMGFLASIAVHRGQVVHQGDLVGTSTGSVHFGARAGDVYLDPLGLLAAGPPRVLLVADDDRRPAPVARERFALRQGLLGSGLLRRGAGVLGATAWAGRRGVGAVGAVARRGRAVVPRALGVASRLPIRLVGPVSLLAPAWAVLTAVRAAVVVAQATAARRGPCTAAAVPEPVLRERRIVVLVPGLDSNLHGGFPHALDTRGLGYAPADTEVYSYRGGAQPYEGDETTLELHAAAAQLRQFLRARAALDPGVPIDVIAHSQGGLVARAALALPVPAGEPPLPPVAHVVTLSSPHGGAPLAGVATELGRRQLARAFVWLHDVLLDGFEARGDSIPQLAPGSDLLRELDAASFPTGTRARTIGARYDIVVPSPGAGIGRRRADVVVDPGGPLHAHSDIASSAAGRREVALAVNDLPPGCEGRVDRLGDALAGGVIWAAETTVRDVLRPVTPW